MPKQRKNNYCNRNQKQIENDFFQVISYLLHHSTFFISGSIHFTDKNFEKRLGENCNFLLIIKNTPFIDSLYGDKGFNIFAFDNKYAYCVKGRNDRNAEHLIITNY